MDLKETDQRYESDKEVFSYSSSKDNKVFIFWHGKQVMVLKGTDGDKFLQRMTSADAKEAQQIMAKVTGNFKRGNERRLRFLYQLSC